MSPDKKYIPQLLVHILLWASLYGLLLYPFVSQSRPIPPDSIAILFMAMAMFYFNYFYLVTKLLLKKSIITYVISSLLLIILASMLVNFAFPPTFADNLPHRPQGPNNMLFRNFIRSVFTFGIPYIISVVLRIYKEWEKNDELRIIVENEKIHSELKFLKTQLNPHFLFNSLNAIYALSVKKSLNTSEAVINLSELMRYTIYEADKDLVPLGKELEYIKSYVQLQRLRLSDSKNVSLRISGEEKGKAIPPLLFISFIENAFKYGTDYEGKTNVKINLLINDESIHMQVSNKIGVFRKHTDSSGVGLENVRNRLRLLYPEAHELIIKNDGKIFSIDLTLKQ